jgi:anti-sigma factor RsiW
MKNDVLERLLIDRAAGELSPDVEELLEAHLDQEPAARREAAEIDETLRLASLALAGQPVAALPGSQPSRRVPSWALAMAACFVCGLSLGFFSARGRTTLPHTASVHGEPTAAIVAADDPGFWSARRLHAGLSPVTVKAGSPVIWKSPVKRPEIL